MVKSQHKVLSLILCLILAISAVSVGIVGASAASGDTVYFKPGHWTEANAWFSAYAWNDGNDNTFVKMTEVESGVYGADLGKSYSNIIFCRNNPNNSDVSWSSVWNQTKDLTVPSDSNCFAVNSGEWTGASGTWSTYGGGSVVSTTAAPTTATTATTATQATTAVVTPTTVPVSTGGTVVYLKNDANWSTPYCYMWNGSSDNNASWPGVKMTEIDDGYWMYEASKEYKNCIFSNNGGSQTADLTAQNGYYFDNSKSAWGGIYDVKPLQVKSYTADPASGIYTGSTVVLSATATSKDSSDVYYKFSVTNASNSTTVLSDYSTASSVNWVPTAAGTYTISFDFKDGAGNENNRTLSLKVEDDSTLAKPVIKTVLPGNLDLIKVNTTATVKVTAGGGKTGTNLLFYKYIVTDPNGSKNKPYYTLNSTYSFKPTVAGKYTVDVYVQGSDNSTVSKTYNYTAVTGDIPTTTVVVPTTAPTTAAPTTTIAPTTVAPTTTVPTTTAPQWQLGDVNKDGRISVQDATYIQKYLAKYTDCLDIDVSIADVNGDGKITVKDASKIQELISN